MKHARKKGRSAPYGMVLSLVFKYFNIPLKGENSFRGVGSIHGLSVPSTAKVTSNPTKNLSPSGEQTLSPIVEQVSTTQPEQVIEPPPSQDVSSPIPSFVTPPDQTISPEENMFVSPPSPLIHTENTCIESPCPPNPPSVQTPVFDPSPRQSHDSSPVPDLDLNVDSQHYLAEINDNLDTLLFQHQALKHSQSLPYSSGFDPNT
ncbi:pollen-specific leucine-rich repeat extensin-like protein 2 [Vicia villosa]|uniref:pollen-specific leucine-rich repeat extensin-like protein 2 n=1 Tax=Vicia villosa TaxID=3911 RepID=UPI00273BF7CA|nr:pollen-specific leucine-rich repeat extensin-like protein 2 [Vicia villosa]